MSDLPTIVLAEDDPNDILLVRRAIRKAGIANPVKVVTDGEAAIAYLADPMDDLTGGGAPQVPALLLLDLKMPRKSGFEVLEWVRRESRMPLLPVVVLTSSREGTDIQRAYDLGANSYLVKPGSPDELLVIIRTLGLYWLILNESPANPP